MQYWAAISQFEKFSEEIRYASNIYSFNHDDHSIDGLYYKCELLIDRIFTNELNSILQSDQLSRTRLKNRGLNNYEKSKGLSELVSNFISDLKGRQQLDSQRTTDYKSKILDLENKILELEFEVEKRKGYENQIVPLQKALAEQKIKFDMQKHIDEEATTKKITRSKLAFYILITITLTYINATIPSLSNLKFDLLKFSLFESGILICCSIAYVKKVPEYISAIIAIVYTIVSIVISLK